MDEYLIVDGYNVINSWPNLVELKKDDLELARDKLVEILQNYQGMQQAIIIVVFDAHLSKAKTRTYLAEGNLQVVYTKAGETADSLIEKMIGELPERSKITVVTNDWDEQRIVMGKGALRMSSRELYYRVSDMGEVISQNSAGGFKKLKSIEGRLHDKVRKKLEEWRRKHL
ncbi:MAG: NYN domain-containing protein [Bacillota bacterium]